MKGIPKNIKTLGSYSSIVLSGDNRYFTYIVDNDLKTQWKYTAVAPSYWRPKRSDEIVEQNEKFVNGFKLVKTANEEFGYVRESDGELLPYRYDIAFDFNENGLAMVGKDGYVSWIDIEFKYINLEGKKVKENLDYRSGDFKGWQEIEQFSKGEKPIAKLYYGRDTYAKVRYIDANGNLMSFRKFDGKIHNNITSSLFECGTSFDKDGVAKADGSYLFARGYYITYKDVREIATSIGLINMISNEAEKLLDEEEGKTLKKTLNEPRSIWDWPL